MVGPRRGFGADPEDRDDLYGTGETFGLVMQRYSRRQVLRAGVVLGAVAAVGGGCSSEDDEGDDEESRADPGSRQGDGGRLTFAPVPPSTADVVAVPGA